MDRKQIGGDHYRTPEGIPEHWDIAWALSWDFYQYQITKYIWRWKDKGGVADLKKAQHFLEKYISVLTEAKGEEPQPHGYVDQDSPTGPARPTSADSPPVASGGEGLMLKYFVLNPTSSDKSHREASRLAIETYAKFCNNPKLAEELRRWIVTLWSKDE